MTQQPATTGPKQQLTVVDAVRKMEPEFRLALPAHIPSERFTRIAVSAINSNPDLLAGDIDKRSLYAAVMKAAQDGLVIDGREAALVTFNSKNGKQAQYMPMVAGIMKKMRNSGDIATISYGLVYQKEFDEKRFEYIKGDNECLRHEPILFGDKGNIIGVYAVVTLKDGSKVREFMDMQQIDKVRKVSRSATSEHGPWKKWFEEMAAKSVLRKVSKLCPMSTDIDRVFAHDDQHVDLETEEPTPEPVKRKGTRAAEKVMATISDDSTVIDGEFTEQPKPVTGDEEIPI